MPKIYKHKPWIERYAIYKTKNVTSLFFANKYLILVGKSYEEGCLRYSYVYYDAPSGHKIYKKFANQFTNKFLTKVEGASPIEKEWIDETIEKFMHISWEG